MIVMTSKAIDKHKRIYHRCECMYAKRIKAENRLELTDEKAKKRHYKECKFCSGLKGDISVHKKALQSWEKKHNMKFTYNKWSDTLYIQTEIGFWKMFLKKEAGAYLLYHRNKYSKDIEFREACKGEFHRQSDVKETNSLQKIVEYISAHDRAKVIIMDDYRKLPHSTKKQKQYYRAAERKDRRNAMRRLDSIFASLERGNSSLRQYSIC